MWRPRQLDPQEDQSLVAFGRLVRRLRRESGLGQQALADRCGCSQSTISRIENGLEPGMPLRRATTILAVLRALPPVRRLPTSPIDHEAHG